MTDFIETADAVVDALEDADDDKKIGMGGKFMVAMANGKGKATLRLFIIMTLIIASLLGYIAEEKLKTIDDRIDGIAKDVHQMTREFKSYTEATSTKLIQHDLNLIQTEDQISALDKEINGNGSPSITKFSK